MSDVRRVDGLFNDVLALPPRERTAFLREYCRNDDALRAEIESLLQAHQAADGFLKRPAIDRSIHLDERGACSDVPETVAPAVGTMVGRYRIVETIASGGMGSVYRALRTDHSFEQQVAIKLIRTSVFSESLRRRFHLERQLLARLEHPGITRLIDGGSTEGGLPYLVMEYVEGRPIDRYCDECRLTITERLRLFRKVCAAVHFAHQHLIVHRDIKPHNILVSPDGRPKLLDFGISKLLDGDTGSTPRDATITSFCALTPRYASPEQVRGEIITTVSDVYSLGVVLYELLTGCRPYRLDTASSMQAARAICELEPAAPSTVPWDTADLVTNGEAVESATPESIALLRGDKPDQLRRHLRGDLDNIVLMALAKDPERRYASVQQFADDIQRYLQGLPVVAQKNTLIYRTAKLIRRNKGVTIAAALAIVGLFAAIVGTSVGLIGARRAERTAQAERNTALHAQSEAQAVTSFLQDVLAAANPYRQGRDVTVLELLADAGRRVETELADQPGVEAGMRMAIAHTYAGMWNWAEAVPHLQAALRILRELRGAYHPDVAECLSLLGRAQTFAQDPAAVELQREGLAIREHLYGTDHPTTADSLGNLGYALWHAASPPCWEDAERYYRQALDVYHRTSPGDYSNIARFTFSLGVMLWVHGRPFEAERCFVDALDIYRRMPEREDRYIVECMKRYALLLTELGRYDEAEELIQESAIISPDAGSAPSGCSWVWNRARIRSARGDLAGAERFYRMALVTECERLAARRPDHAEQLLAFVPILVPNATTQHVTPPILEIFQTLTTLSQRGLVARDIVLFDIAVLECRKGRHEIALPLFERSHAAVRSRPTQDQWRFGDAHIAYANCLVHTGQNEKAEDIFLSTLEMLTKAHGGVHPDIIEVEQRLVELQGASVGPASSEQADGQRATDRVESYPGS